MATSDISLDQLTDGIRNTYLADKENGFSNVEDRLKEAFVNCSPVERSELLEKLIAVFNQDHESGTAAFGEPSNVYNQVLTMLLGKEILKKKLTPKEMLDQLMTAINTVFDSVNTLVGGINATLMGNVEEEETIRMVICSSMDGDQGLGALKKFLDRIGGFFAIALQAYKDSARIKIDEILDELNPARLEEEFGGKMKFGPLYKAQLFDCYLEKYKTLQNWQRSGLLLEAFLKEFEKKCQYLYSNSNLK